MRIALVAPLSLPIPATGYGGTQRILHNLIEEYVAAGHSVTLYGVGGSCTSARLIPVIETPLWSQGIGSSSAELKPFVTVQLCAVFADVFQHDVIHIHHGPRPFHVDFFRARGNAQDGPPVIWTDHTDLDRPWKLRVFAALHAHHNMYFTALSNSHRAGGSPLVSFTTVYNGIPKDLLHPTGVTPIYAAFLGRLSPLKGAHVAIRIAASAKLHLKVAGPYHGTHEYTEELRANMALHDVEYVGEIDDPQKSDFLSGAVALLFPIDWEEPFGLVVIEAMACGTPVVAFRRGAVPELIEDGVTGFIVDTEGEAVEKLKEGIRELDRARIRHEFERRFTAKTMAEGYLRLYRQVCAEDVGKCPAKFATGQSDEFRTVAAVSSQCPGEDPYTAKIMSSVSVGSSGA